MCSKFDQAERAKSVEVSLRRPSVRLSVCLCASVLCMSRGNLLITPNQLRDSSLVASTEHREHAMFTQSQLYQ